MESSVIELSKYRFQCACENLNDAKLLMDAGSFKSSVNRSYYVIFHMLRAVTALRDMAKEQIERAEKIMNR